MDQTKVVRSSFISTKVAQDSGSRVSKVDKSRSFSGEKTRSAIDEPVLKTTYFMGEISALSIGKPLTQIRPGNGLNFTKVAKVAQNSLPLMVPRFRGMQGFRSKVDKNRPSLTHVKSGRMTILTPPRSMGMLFSESASALFCKEQRNTKPCHMFFHIQIIGIERDRPLSTKEVLWKR